MSPRIPEPREQEADLSPDRFAVHHADTPGASIAYVHEGEGGLPLLLVHGWPETKRIWWRNISVLANAGFEVIAPDLRGFGDSGAADDFYDVAASCADVHHLVADVLGHAHCVAVGGNFGGVVVQDLTLRHPGLVERAVLFNTIPPFIFDDYERAGVEAIDFAQNEHFTRHGQKAGELLHELHSPTLRRDYVAEVYSDAGWAGVAGFSASEQAFMTEPFGDEDAFRTSIRLYEYAFGRTPKAPPMLFEPNSTVTLVLYGPEDAVVPPAFVDCMAVAFPNVIGPFSVTGAGHFLQWEKAALFNRTIEWFCRDLLVPR
ncbi:MAG: alpha/beta fold hydrolase [Acidimicrobiales bacterium]